MMHIEHFLALGPAPSAVLCGLLLGISLLLYRSWSTLDLLRIPSPWGNIPILGHVVQMALHVSNGHEQFLKWHEAYGRFVRIRILHRDIVLVADPKAASELLSKGPNECPRRTPEYTTFNVAHGMSGYSAILTEQDEERWRTIRKTIAPAYSPSNCRDLFPKIVDSYAAVCQRIMSNMAEQEGMINHSSPVVDLQLDPKQQTADLRGDGSSSSSNSAAVDVNISEAVFAATIRLTAEGFLKMPDEKLFDFRQAAVDAESLVAIVNTFISQPWKKWLYLSIPNLCKESRAFHRQRTHLMSVTKLIADHVISYRPAADTDMSLVACLSRLREPSGSNKGCLFTQEALQAEAFLELVGQESIPWTIAWTLYLLSQHPSVEAAVVDELQSAGIPCNGDVQAVVQALSVDTLKQLPYCTAVIHEAMRMFPAGVAATPRMTEKVTQVGPYSIPAGVIVFPCLYSIMMFSGNWEKPHVFDPQRWMAEADCSLDPATGSPQFVPFGIGPKACVAQHLAMMQCKVLLVLLVACFRWTLAPRMGGPAGVLSETVAALELRVAQGMWLRPMMRS